MIVKYEKVCVNLSEILNELIINTKKHSNTVCGHRLISLFVVKDDLASCQLKDVQGCIFLSSETADVRQKLYLSFIING